MRLLLVIYGHLEQLSGGYLYDRKVVELLRDRGEEVDILPLPQLPYLLCPLHSFHPPLLRLFAGPGAGGGYDCIIVDELTHPSVFLPVSLRSRLCPPVVGLVHHLKAEERISLPLRTLSRAMERCLLRRCDGLIVNSRTTGSSVRRLLGGRAAVHVCLPGSDMGEVPAEQGVTEGAREAGKTVRLLITGNIIHRKGHDRLVRMLGGLADLDWELRVVGAAVDPGFRRKVERLARRLGIQDRILWKGVLSGAELLRQYLEADLFVFPSRYEGFGISLAEALRAGLPFVAFASGAIPEVTEGRGGLIAEGDSRGFQRLLRRLIADAVYRERSAALSRRLASGLPAWRQTGEAFLQAVKEIIG
jgi:glycosyltransferase involved in cell wall biosynthesis